MNNRTNNRQNGRGRRQENNSEGSWSPYRELSPDNSHGNRFDESHSQQSSIDFGQRDEYNDPYREYGGGQGYENRGDYRGNDAEFGFREPGAPRHGTQGYRSQEYGTEGQDFETQSFGSRSEGRWNDPAYGQGDQGYPQQQQYGSPQRDGSSRPRSQSWSEGNDRSGGYGPGRNAGGFGEGRGSAPWSPSQSSSERTHQQAGWGSSRNESEGEHRSERSRNDSSSSYDRPWEDGPFSGRGPKGYERPDDRIREEACERLAYHGRIDPSEVDVSVEKGEVKLSGTCTSRREKRMIEDVIDSVRGVRDVRNELSIIQSGKKENHSSDDSSKFGNKGDSSTSRSNSGNNGGRTQSKTDSPSERKSTSKQSKTTT